MKGMSRMESCHCSSIPFIDVQQLDTRRQSSPALVHVGRSANAHGFQAIDLLFPLSSLFIAHIRVGQ